MLILSRFPHEELVFQVAGITFTVQVTSVNGNRVRLGIEAPKEVIVQRREIFEKANSQPLPKTEQVDEYAHLYQEIGGSE